MSKVENIAAQLAAAANVKDKWGGIVVNAKASPFNAKGDGITDDTIALQAAVDYAISIGKKEITLPAGTYIYTVLTNISEIVFIGDGVTLTGTTALKLTSAATQLADITSINDVLVKARDFDTLDDAIASAGSALTALPTHSGTANTSTTVTLILEKKQYDITSAITIPDRIIIEGNGAILNGADAGRIFNSTTAYRVSFRNILFYGNDTEAIYFDCPNLDNSRYEFVNCIFATHTRSAGVYAVWITSQSANVVFDNCDVTAAPNFLYVDSDFCTIDGGWINGWDSLSTPANTKPADSCSIENHTREMRINNAIFIPEEDGSGTRDNVRWIDNYGQITIIGCHFGAENGGFPIIYQFITSVTDIQPFANYADILIEGGQAATGATNRFDSGLVVLQDGIIPGRFTFNNITKSASTKLVSASGYDFNGTDASVNALLQAAIYAESNRTILDQIDINYWGISNRADIPSCLQPFINRNNLNLSTQGRSTAFPLDTATIVVELFKRLAGSSPQRAAISADVSIQISGNISGPKAILQIKRYKIRCFWDTGSSPFLETTDVDFEEYAPSTGALGDILITFAHDSGTKTTSYAAWNLTVATGLSNLGVSWVVNNIQKSLNDSASAGEIIARSYE